MVMPRKVPYSSNLLAEQNRLLTDMIKRPEFLVVNALYLHWGGGPLEPAPLHSTDILDGVCCLDGTLLCSSSKIKHLALISLTVVAFSRSGSRKWAPHPVEVEAILQNNTKISHKICFPNETEQVRTYLFFQP